MEGDRISKILKSTVRCRRHLGKHSMRWTYQ